MKCVPRTVTRFSCLLFSALALLLVIATVACAPSTPTPYTPTGSPSAQVTPNGRATEAAIISHIFATMTASAPTVAPTRALPTVAPTATTAAKPPTATSAPKAVVRATATSAPVVPKATTDPYLAQIPKGKGGILVVSYVGAASNFTIVGAGCPGDACAVDANGKRLIVVDPGTYNISVQIIGPPGGGWSDTVTVAMDRYLTYRIAVNQ